MYIEEHAPHRQVFGDDPSSHPVLSLASCCQNLMLPQNIDFLPRISQYGNTLFPDNTCRFLTVPYLPPLMNIEQPTDLHV